MQKPLRRASSLHHRHGPLRAAFVQLGWGPNRFVLRSNVVRQPSSTMTYSEFLAREASGEQRHEFLEGQVFAMAGGSPEHGALAAAFIGELRLALRGKPCRVFSSDVRVRIQATGLTTYPDVSVVCGRLETDAVDADAIVNPVLVVEVLSDSTEAYDRGAKAAHYRRIPSLREYVLVSQHEPRIEVYRRNEQGRFELFEVGTEQLLELSSVGIALRASAIYHKATVR